MKTGENMRGALRYLFVAVVTILALQSLTVVVHELTHSSVAWIFGEMENPLGIVWGNPLTMTGWDENVDYQRLFAQGRTTHAAIIGFSPLVMHSIVVGICFLYLRGLRDATEPRRRRWLYHVFYWLAVVNLMELVAYVFMRAFATHGDTGIFDRATGLSPWWLFTVGSLALLWALTFLYRRGLPLMESLFAWDGPAARWTLLLLTSFVVFLWGSGIRILLYVSGPQWAFGLIGGVGFILAVALFRPQGWGRARVDKTGGE